ncbi:uncharacterized protein TRIADDRAFT_35067, partial [Trichoplax adhaerens]
MLILSATTLVLGGIIGIFPNVIIVVTVYRNKSFRKPTYFFITNLAVCDLMQSAATVFNLFLTAIDRQFQLPLSVLTVLCKIFAIFLKYWSYTASMQTLIIISGERYHAIFRPTRKLSTKRARSLCFLSWVISFAIAFPYLI